jgi:hypothetical protein
MSTGPAPPKADHKKKPAKPKAKAVAPPKAPADKGGPSQPHKTAKPAPKGKAPQGDSLPSRSVTPGSKRTREGQATSETDIAQMGRQLANASTRIADLEARLQLLTQDGESIARVLSRADCFAASFELSFPQVPPAPTAVAV